MQRLTKSLLSKIDPARETRERGICDAEIQGFGVRIRPSTEPCFYFRYQSPTAKKIRTISIGSIKGIELDIARAIAREYRGYVVQGKDPQDVRKETSGFTMAELWERYRREWALKRNRPSTILGNDSLWRKYGKPWSARQVAAITPADAMAWIGQVNGKTTPNRMRSLMHKMFNLAIRWEMRPDGRNPFHGLEKNPETKRERVLMPEELRRLWKVLERHVDDPVATLARLSLLTGTRPSEMRCALMGNIDWQRQVLVLPESKTGKGEIELTSPVIAIIRAVKRPTNSPYIVPGYSKGRPVLSPWGRWRMICQEAGLEDFRQHDLRHLFGTYADHAGATQRQIMDMLRHTSFVTSQRYVHGFKTVRRQGVEQTVDSILGFIRDETSTIERGIKIAAE